MFLFLYVYSLRKTTNKTTELSFMMTLPYLLLIKILLITEIGMFFYDKKFVKINLHR